MSSFRAIGRAIAAAVNADYTGTLAGQFTAALDWVPTKKLTELKDLDVAIVRKEATGVRADRTNWRDSWAFDIAIRKRFDVRKPEASEIEPYEDLTEELRAFLRDRAITAGVEIARCEAADISLPYEPEAFSSQHVFLSVITAVFVVSP